VKPSAKTPKLQLNLLLSDAPTAALPNDKQRELIVAIAEMLVSAARQSVSHPVRGNGDESEID
jgi:hypothetical protein